jgi:hypothetical protein
MHIFFVTIMRLAITYHNTDDDGDRRSERRHGRVRCLGGTIVGFQDTMTAHSRSAMLRSEAMYDCLLPS